MWNLAKTSTFGSSDSSQAFDRHISKNTPDLLIVRSARGVQCLRQNIRKWMGAERLH